MGLAAAYRTKFLKQDLIKRNQIRRGDILIGKYKSKRTGKVSNKVSFVLDWAPFKGNIAERKLYVFDLDKLHPSILKKLIKKVGGLEFTNTSSFTYHRVKIGMKPRDGAIVYNKYIRDFIQEIKGVWKTYNLINYKQVKLCDYDYSGMFRDLPPRITIEEKMTKINEEITDLNNEYNEDQRRSDAGFLMTTEQIKENRSRIVTLNIEKDKLIRRRAKGELV